MLDICSRGRVDGLSGTCPLFRFERRISELNLPGQDVGNSFAWVKTTAHYPEPAHPTALTLTAPKNFTSQNGATLSIWGSLTHGKFWKNLVVGRFLRFGGQRESVGWLFPRFSLAANVVCRPLCVRSSKIFAAFQYPPTPPPARPALQNNQIFDFGQGGCFCGAKLKS